MFKLRGKSGKQYLEEERHCRQGMALLLPFGLLLFPFFLSAAEQMGIKFIYFVNSNEQRKKHN